MERKVLEPGEKAIYYRYGLFLDAEIIAYRSDIEAYNIKPIKKDDSDRYLSDTETISDFDIYPKTIDGYADLIERSQNKRDYFDYKLKEFKEELHYLEKLEEQKLNKVEG